jgi:hypothetical protein
VQKFLEHFAAIRARDRRAGVWDEADGLFYDRLVIADGAVCRRGPVDGRDHPCCRGVVDERQRDRHLPAGKHFADFLDRAGLRDATSSSSWV